MLTDARQQLDDLTHYIDGSMIYGSSAELQEELREDHGGLLRSRVRISKSLTTVPCSVVLLE